VILWLSGKGYATGPPDWRTGRTSTSAARTFLTPRLLTAAANRRSVLLSARALSSTGHVGDDDLVNQRFVVFPAKRRVGYFHAAAVYCEI
jgi:hypothetical protein